MVVLSDLLNLVTASIAALVTIFAVLIMQKLQTGSKKAMVSFQLHPEKTKQEFVLLLLGSAVMTLGFFAYLWGSIAGDVTAMNVGRLGPIMYVAVGAYVMLKWWRRF